MEWRDVAHTVGQLAPALGGAVGGPAGAAAGGLVARALGVAARPEAVAEALQADPAAAIKLRRIEADLEATLIQGRAQVVTAEAQGEGWLQRNWRPLTMMWFAGLVGAHWLGMTPENLDPAAVSQLMDIVQLGIGGYVIGRSAEKIVKTASGAGILDHLKTKR